MDEYCNKNNVLPQMIKTIHHFVHDYDLVTIKHSALVERWKKLGPNIMKYTKHNVK